jgi:chromosome segregation ATPase
VSNTINPPLDSRLLNAMKRLRLENINLQRQLRALQADLGQANAQATDAEFRSRELEIELSLTRQQLEEFEEARLRLELLETARQQWEAQSLSASGMAQRQQVELQELRTLLRQREEEISQLQQANQAGSQELERVRHQARQVIVQHYQAMKTAQEQAQQAFEEVRRNKTQLDAIRAPMGGGRRKVLPPRSLRPTSSLQASNLQPVQGN